jgi:amidase
MDDLAFAGPARHAALIAAGELSARELTELYLARIARLDPVLNAFRVVLAEKALAEAGQADGRRRAGDRRPLLGVPVAIKDEIDVAGEISAFGCDADAVPAKADAEVVRRLRAAGAVIIGKTHVPELMITPFTESPTFGVTRNPWDPHRTSGGSSGGSGTAIAAGLVSAALGSDGAGSIRIPAACCGLFGLKPQFGRVPTAPDVKAFRRMNVFGPIARSVEDAALLMRVIADAFPPLPEPRPLRIAVSTGLPPGLGVRADAEQLAGVERVAAALRDAGHTVFERDLDWGPTMGNRVLARFLRGIADKAAEVGHAERLSRRARGIVRIGRAIPERAAAAAGRAAADDALRLGAIFADADLVLTPMFTRRPPRVREYDGRGGAYTLAGMVRFAPYAGAFNHTGQPALAVPAGFAADGFPVGAQLVGPPDSEPLLLAAGAQLQRVREWHTHIPAMGAAAPTGPAGARGAAL